MPRAARSFILLLSIAAALLHTPVFSSFAAMAGKTFPIVKNGGDGILLASDDDDEDNDGDGTEGLEEFCHFNKSAPACASIQNNAPTAPNVTAPSVTPPAVRTPAPVTRDPTAPTTTAPSVNTPAQPNVRTPSLNAPTVNPPVPNTPTAPTIGSPNVR